MGLWRWMFPTIPDTGGLDQLRPQLEAWTDDAFLYDVAWNLGLDVDTMPLTRAAALRVPAMARARNLTCGTVGALPIEARRGDELVATQPYWCYGTDGQLGNLSDDDQARLKIGPQTPYQRHLWTVDDLLFHGQSMWIITDRYTTGHPSRMLRIPFESWDVLADGTVGDMDGKPIPMTDLVWIPGAADGLLTNGAATLRMAYDLERNARDVALRPLRLEAHQTSAAELTADERKRILKEIRTAMRDNDGVLFTNNALELKEHRIDAEALQLGARNQSALDVARLANMPALMIDATAQGASLEYQTATGRNQEWVDYGLAMWMDPIEARLGMDDVLPAGQRAAFNTTEWTALAPSPTGPATAD